MEAGSLSAPLACVVVNPSKRKVTGLVRDLVDDGLHRAGYRGPVWLETTAVEAGAAQARLAVASGARLVVAAGGDGTVRSVAAGLAGTSAEMGILPLGTANLAARNLRLPVHDLSAAVQVIAYGRPSPTDLAWVSTDPADEPATRPHGGSFLPGIRSGTHSPAPVGSGSALSALTVLREEAEAAPDSTTSSGPTSPSHTSLAGTAAAASPGTGVPARPPGGWAQPTLGREHACMVVAGVGFDAGLVASTRPALKARIGWGAYALAAMENLRFPRMDLVLSLDSAPAEPAGAPGPHGPGNLGSSADAQHLAGWGEDHGLGGSRGRDPGRQGGRVGKRRVERFTARTLLIANGGLLPAGITLLRDTRPDDGLLDVAAIDTVGGVVGWSSLARQVLPPRAATYSDPTRATGRVVRRRGSDVVVRVGSPVLVEVDGDLLPPARGVHVRLAPGAVRVRRP